MCPSERGLHENFQIFTFGNGQILHKKFIISSYLMCINYYHYFHIISNLKILCLNINWGATAPPPPHAHPPPICHWPVPARAQGPECNFRTSSSLNAEVVQPINIVFRCIKIRCMDKFVSQKCKTASFALYKVGKIRQFLDTKTIKNLVQALVLCHLDYCNSLLFNMPDSQISKLQLIQNSAARLITGRRQVSHITPVLDQLHLVPVQVRINFKILLLTFQCLHDMAPATYLKELLVQYVMYVPSRNLRSSHRYILQCPKFSTKYYGERTFLFAAASLWNTLPIKIK